MSPQDIFILTLFIIGCLLSGLATWAVVSDIYYHKGFYDCYNSKPTQTISFRLPNKE